MEMESGARFLAFSIYLMVPEQHCVGNCTGNIFRVVVFLVSLIPRMIPRSLNCHFFLPSVLGTYELRREKTCLRGF